MHHTVKYSYDGERITAMFCNHCDYSLRALDFKRTRTGHRWPRMSHAMKRHIRDEHNINLYKREG